MDLIWWMAKLSYYKSISIRLNALFSQIDLQNSTFVPSANLLFTFYYISLNTLYPLCLNTIFPLSKNQPATTTAINYCTKINPNQTNQPTKIIRKSTQTKESTHKSPICEHFEALVVVMSSMSTQWINPLRTSITTKRERERERMNKKWFCFTNSDEQYPQQEYWGIFHLFLGWLGKLFC